MGAIIQPFVVCFFGAQKQTLQLRRIFADSSPCHDTMLRLAMVMGWSLGDL